MHERDSPDSRLTVYILTAIGGAVVVGLRVVNAFGDSVGAAVVDGAFESTTD